MKLGIKYLKKMGIEFTVNDNGHLKIGSSLDLRGTQITALPDNLTVGGSLDLEGTQINRKEYNISVDFGFALRIKKLTNADGIWARIISEKGRLAKVKIFGKRKVSYLATSEDGKHHAHGETAKKALEELAFKTANRDVSQYRNMPLDTLKTPNEWAIVYHVVTGACRQGCKIFMAQKGRLKEQYSLSEILEETKGAFGHDKFKEVVNGT